MLISLNWIRDFIDLPADVDARDLAERFTIVTAEVTDAEAIHPKNLGGKDITREEYEKNLAFYTPEKVEEISGVPAHIIRLIADKMADPNELVLSWWCMGPNQHIRGTAMNSLRVRGRG